MKHRLSRSEATAVTATVAGAAAIAEIVMLAMGHGKPASHNSLNTAVKSVPTEASTTTSAPQNLPATSRPTLQISAPATTLAEVQATPGDNLEAIKKQATDFYPNEKLVCMPFSIAADTRLKVYFSPNAAAGTEYTVPASGIEFLQPQKQEVNGAGVLSAVLTTGKERLPLFVPLTAENEAVMKMSSFSKPDWQPFHLITEDIQVSTIDAQSGSPMTSEGRPIAQVLLQQDELLVPSTTAPSGSLAFGG